MTNSVFISRSTDYGKTWILTPFPDITGSCAVNKFLYFSENEVYCSISKENGMNGYIGKWDGFSWSILLSGCGANGMCGNNGNDMYIAGGEYWTGHILYHYDGVTLTQDLSFPSSVSICDCISIDSDTNYILAIDPGLSIAYLYKGKFNSWGIELSGMDFSGYRTLPSPYWISNYLWVNKNTREVLLLWQARGLEPYKRFIMHFKDEVWTETELAEAPYDPSYYNIYEGSLGGICAKNTNNILVTNTHSSLYSGGGGNYLWRYE